MNESQLKRYRKILLQMDNRLESDIEELSDEIASAGIVVGEHGAHVRESLEKEIVLEQNEETIRRAVQLALQRIEAGKFGICESCGKKISAARIDALPYASICINCERINEAS